MESPAESKNGSDPINETDKKHLTVTEIKW